MKVYIIRGFTSSAYYDEWLNFGAFTNQKDAEKEMLRLAVEAFDKADLYNAYYGSDNKLHYACVRKCEYLDGKLVAIYDDRGVGEAAEVNLTIDVLELK